MKTEQDPSIVEPTAPGAAPPVVEQAAPDGVAADMGRPAIRSTRAGRAWLAILPGMVALAVGLVFVFQNTQRARVSFFTASGDVPLAVALFAAFALGAVVVLLLGSIRILQLRKTIHHPSS